MVLAQTPLDTLLAQHPCVTDFIASLGLPLPAGARPLGDWVADLLDDDLADAGLERGQMVAHIAGLIAEVRAMAEAREVRVGSLTLLGGRDKAGGAETLELQVRAGEVICVVGPTGCGKSRLLADIECLAAGDTPTGRRVLIDGLPAAARLSGAPEARLVAQISQNMNFVVDLSVRDLIGLHARCRLVPDPEALTERVIACANDLTGERFDPETAVTQLSGGQTRALMIADVALLSASPVVLIDEIENAGVDRRRALELLVTGEKIVFISTHDPLLALRGDRRVVIRNGGIVAVIETSPRERANLERIEALDAAVMSIRERLRRGERIEEDLAWPR